MQTHPTERHLFIDDPPILLAILIAARKTGAELLEEVIRRELQDRHGIEIVFTRPDNRTRSAHA